MASSTGLAVFDALAADVHRRMGTEATAGLPDAACEALEAARLHERITHAEILRWGVSAPALPRQDITARFGEPALEVYRDDDLFIQVLTWMDGTTAIHQHGFSGAFCVLQGSSCHTRYQFRDEEQPCERLKFGELSYRGVEFLVPGACRPIHPGSGFIHALFHVERPSVTVVVRNTKLEEHQPQWSYVAPGLALHPFGIPDALERRQEVLRAMALLDPDGAHEAVAERLASADLHEAWCLLQTLLPASKKSPQFEALLDHLERQHGQAGQRIRAALAAEHRSKSITGRRELVRDPEDRWLMAILLNVPTRTDVLGLIAERHPTHDPVSWLMARLEALGHQPAPQDYGGSTLGLVLDDLSTALCEGLLRGEPRQAVIQRLVARDGAAAGDAAWLERADQMLRQSHLLGRLLT